MATTTYAFIDPQGSQPNLNVFDNTYLSPYSGATGTSADESLDTPVKLFCDDFADHVTWGSSWTANLTAVNAADLSNTRYGSANNNTTYPTGTTLYEEMAWLFTQQTAPGQTPANVDQIQEAVWIMTGAPGTTPTGAGVANINNWITAAQSYYLSDANQTPSTYEVADYSRWTVVTDTESAGKPTGFGNQEFLSYATSGGFTGNGPGRVPEPASFLLFGGGLLGIGLLRRRKPGKS
ncbi:MAG: PEP-CTERM sorting domain-containing protein [Terriglobia bacterium]